MGLPESLRESAGPVGAAATATFDDWPVPGSGADAAECWKALAASEADDRAAWSAEWDREREVPWTAQAFAVVRQALALDSSEGMRRALGGSIVNWLASAIERCEWAEATLAYECLGLADPDGTRTGAALASVLSGVDAQAVAERRDEASPEAQARFFALTVQLGRAALDLVVGVLGSAARPRLRAASTTALTYTCADDPRPLARYLADSRWHVVRNIVFVLGAIGGDSVTDLLALAARHLDARVRRAVVAALGQVSPARRLPLLLAQLDTADAPTLTAVLAMLTRAPDPRVAEALLERIGAIDFESRSEEIKVALLSALAETADDGAVPALETLLTKGGWFARRSPERNAAAHTLARIGTRGALLVLEEGRRSRSEAVRAACTDALAWRSRAA